MARITTFKRALIAAPFAAAVAAAPSWAQSERLPLTSRSEAFLNEMNRSIAIQQQLRGYSQQTQFEINQLRSEIRRSRQFPLMTGPGVRLGCPPGSIGC